MHILHVINSLHCGGAQRLVVDLCAEQCAAGHRVTLLTLNNVSDAAMMSGLPTSPRFRLRCLHIKQAFSLSALNHLFRTLRHLRNEDSADVAHVHLFPAGYLMAMCREVAPPMVYTEHSTSNRRRNIPLLRGVERLIYSKFDVVTGVSDSCSEALRSWLNNDSLRIETIYNGINLNHFTPIADEKSHKYSSDNLDVMSIDEEEAPTTADGNGRIVLMISRFAESKDYASVIRAAKLFDGDPRYDDMRFVFLGDGPTLRAMQDLAKRLGVADRITFAGKRDDVADMIRKAWIGIQSSHYEGFGLTAIEMMAGGIPVIATDLPGLNDSTADAALRVPHADPTFIAKAIRTLASHPDLYSYHRTLGLRQAAKFDIANCAANYETLYRSIVREADQ